MEMQQLSPNSCAVHTDEYHDNLLLLGTVNRKESISPKLRSIFLMITVVILNLTIITVGLWTLGDTEGGVEESTGTFAGDNPLLKQVLEVLEAEDDVNLHGFKCVNPIIDTNRFREGATLSPSKWLMVQTHVMQRHMDRWMYAHPLIHNACWQKQLNSTNPTMQHQCADINRSSIWQHKNFTGDPYAIPSNGYCNEKQLTLQGQEHSEKLGRTYRKEYVGENEDESTGGRKLLWRWCDAKTVRIASEDALKNQITLEYVYKGLCGKFPDLEEYPRHKVVSNGSLSVGTPFHIFPGTSCNGTRLHDLLRVGQKAKMQSGFWTKVTHQASEVARMTNHTDADPNRAADLLDSVFDCMVSHTCHGLRDTPPEIQKAATAHRIDYFETKSRTWIQRHFSSTNKTAYDQLRRLQFGYYFKVLMDKMMSAVDGTGKEKLSIEVISDSTITLVLDMLNITDGYDYRPPWGSSLVFELYKNVEDIHLRTSSFAVVIMYNGVALNVCSDNSSGSIDRETNTTHIPIPTSDESQYRDENGNRESRHRESSIHARKSNSLDSVCACSWEEWSALMNTIIPAPEECPDFYKHYNP
eukprot:CFRG7363T1